MAAQRVRFGAARAMKEKEVRIRHPRSIASTMSIIWAALVKSSDLSFPGRLGGWAGGTKLPPVSGPCVPRNEGCVQGELRVSGVSSLLVFGVPKKLSGGIVTASKQL